MAPSPLVRSRPIASGKTLKRSKCAVERQAHFRDPVSPEAAVLAINQPIAARRIIVLLEAFSSPRRCSCTDANNIVNIYDSMIGQYRSLEAFQSSMRLLGIPR